MTNVSAKLFIVALAAVAGFALPTSGVQAAGSGCDSVSASFTVNSGDHTATSRDVLVHVTALNTVQNPAEFVISESQGFGGAEFQPLPADGTVPFTLSEGDGVKTIFLIVKNGCSQTPTISDFVTLTEAPPVPEVLPELNEVPAIGGGTDPGLTFEIFIVNPDGEERDMQTNAKKTEESEDVIILGFEDKTDNDFNDVVVRVDKADPTSPVVEIVEVNARLDHKIGMRFYSAGTQFGEEIVHLSSHESIGKKIAIGELTNALFKTWQDSLAVAPEEAAAPVEEIV